MATVLCRLSGNPSTKREIELLVPVPTSQAQCKNGGWQTFGFVDQGQCVRYVETGKEQVA